MELTSPTLSPVKSVCKFCSFLSRASCSSSRRSASSSLSSSSSVSDSEDRGVPGRNTGWSRLWPRRVRTEEEEGLFIREGELLLNELRRARTPSGVASRMDVDNLPRLSRRLAPEPLRRRLGESPATDGDGPSVCCDPPCALGGLNEPLIT